MENDNHDFDSELDEREDMDKISEEHEREILDREGWDDYEDDFPEFENDGFFEQEFE